MKRPLLVLAGTAALLLLAGAGARAGSVGYTPCGPFVSPIPGCYVPTPCQVPGKEYSNFVDKNQMGNADAMQVLMWDGQGGVADTFDYGDGLDVDALANCQDALYHAVINDQASLLWSTGTPNAACPPCMDPNIYYERPGPCACNTAALWAAANTVNASTHGTPPVSDLNDVDGLEVWGEEMQDDSNRYSLAGDPVWGPTGGPVAVFAYDPTTGASTPWLYDAAIAAALQPLVGTLELDDIDLDAMMTWDADCGTGEFDLATDSIMFSLAPVTGTLDGGEIFVYDALGARYLDHGCHLWDTNFVVKGYADGLCENVNALEAVSVPEPVTMAGLMLAVGSLAGYVRRRRK